MTDSKISAELRTEFGKGAARRIRRADKVPAVLYGHGTDPVHLSLPGHDMMLALRQANVLLTLDIKGQKEQLALPKQVQRDPITGFLEHVDLLIVKRGEKVVVEVPVLVTGEAAPDTTVNQDLMSLALEVDATNIPEQVEISIEGLEAGSQILVSDVTLPEGATATEDPETLVIGINQAQELDVETEGEGDEAAEGEAAEAAEGE
ncbi:50S ribosomal protein L25/general stress protein Ctc [Luteococcus sp. Sow4_B9]|uniref:50S ribosomal protein L25/general stress protein Ctc n=1 Tax=Luteococcus sp. Sow4_B9 TaxID=3438792 RepID=UPI003F9D0F1F